MSRIVSFSGSVRSGSFNAKLVTQASDLAIVAGADVDLVDLGALALPIYNGDAEDLHGVPVAAQDLANRLRAADGIMIATPEYNGSVSALLKNTIDWVSRVERSLFHDRPLGLLAASPGGRGAANSLASLNGILHWMGGTIHAETFSLPNCGEAFAEDVLQGAERDRLAAWVSDYVAAVSAFEPTLP